MDKLLIWGMTDTRDDAICLDDEFGLMLTKVRIPVPAPKLNYVEIPLSNTVIDFSEFADAIHFEQSITRLTFVRAAAGTRESWLELWLNIQAAIHGEEFHWCFASDESNIYTGRFILSDWLSSGALGTFVLEIQQTRKTVEQVAVTLTDGQGNTEATYALKGETYTIPASPFTRTGYTWFRWNTAADGSGADYDPGDEITLTADTTLYAIWGHVITFNANGGSGTMAALQVDEGDSVTLTTNAYTYTGHTFDGWNTLADGSGTDYADEATITPSADITLYAKWAGGVVWWSPAESYFEFAPNTTLLQVAGTNSGTTSDLAGNIILPTTLGGVTVTGLAGGSFYYAPDVTGVRIPDSYTEFAPDFATGALWQTLGLKRAELPSTMTEIPAGMFTLCTALEEFEVPEGITKINGNAFAQCRALETIELPSTLTSMLGYVFNGADNLTTLKINATTPPTLNRTFSGMPSGVAIIVPYSADHSVLAAYKAASVWKTRASDIVEDTQ